MSGSALLYRSCAVMLLTALTGCTAADGGSASAPADAADTQTSDDGAADANDTGSASDTTTDTAQPPDTLPPDGGALGAPCAENADCGSGICFFLDQDAPGFCSAYCLDASTCGEENYDCVLLANTGGDASRVCVPATLCLDADGDGFGTGPA